MYTIGFITQGRINQSLSPPEVYKYYNIIYIGMYAKHKHYLPSKIVKDNSK